jgi:hypothetical protein
MTASLIFLTACTSVQLPWVPEHRARLLLQTRAHNDFGGTRVVVQTSPVTLPSVIPSCPSKRHPLWAGGGCPIHITTIVYNLGLQTGRTNFTTQAEIPQLAERSGNRPVPVGRGQGAALLPMGSSAARSSRWKRWFDQGTGTDPASLWPQGALRCC